MKKYKGLAKRSVLWTWAISYIIVLFIPLITVFVNYATNVATIRQEIIRANELTLNNIGDNINHFLEMEKEFYQYSFVDKHLEDLAQYDTKDTFFYGQAKKYLDMICTYSECQSVKMYYMYYRDDLDYVITESTGEDAERYYKRLKHYRSDFVEYDEWRAFVQKGYEKDFFVDRSMLANSEEKLLYYANSIYNASNGKPNILIGIPLEEIAELTDYFDEHMYLTLSINDKPEATFSSGELIDIMPELDRNTNLKLHKESIENNISYSLIISEEYMWKELQGTRNSFAINILLTLIFGIAGTIFLLRRNYQPIQKLLFEMKGTAVEGNEFHEMSTEYQKLKADNVEAKRVVSDQRKSLISSWLLSVMKGRTTRLQTKQTELGFQLNIQGDVALVGFMIPMHDKLNIQHDEMLFFVVDNIFSELMEHYKFYRVEDGRFLLYLFDLRKTSAEEWSRLVTEKSEFMCSMLEEKWGTSLSGVISGTEKKFENIKFLYQKVMMAFEYQNTIGNTGMIQTSTLESRDEGEQFIEYIKSELNTGLRESNMKKLRAITEKLFDEQDRKNFTVIKMYIFDLFPIATEYYRDNESDADKRTKIVHYIELVTQSNGLEELKHSFLSLLEFVCENISNMEQKETNSIVAEIKEYVTSHYQDQNLNISAVAEYLQRNPKYISKIFKDETGEGILDYINRFRIHKAVELLSSGKYIVEEVMQLTGYVNISSFRRNFLKVTGQTPGRYTKQEQK